MSKYITIPLSKRGKHKGKYETIVSVEDKDLTEFNWSIASPTREHKYVKRRIGTRKGSVVLLMHRIILERMLGRKLKKGEMPDHINGDGLDNRRENLRLATRSQNNRNRHNQSNNTSGYKGVFWDNQHQKWHARITVNYKRIHVGLFDDPAIAYQACCEAREKYHGEFANNGE